jgi:hypothetical protein
MNRAHSVCSAVVLAAMLASLVPLSGHAQEQYQYESDLVARKRILPDVGAGFRQLRIGPNGNFYVLTAPAPALLVYDPSGKRVGQIPDAAAANAKNAAIVYGESFDIDHDGHIVVCDRGANAVKVYSPNGTLSALIKIQAPISVAFLPGDEIVVASPNGEHLVTAYDLSGKLIRDYGDREEIADRSDLNTQANFGHLTTDESGNNYFSFDYLPEPTVRKFDRVGYLASEISLKTLEFEPAAQAARKAIARSESLENSIPSLHRIISAVGVDSHSQELWIAIGTLLMRFDKEGMRLASFRVFLPRGGALEPSQILVDHDKLLMGADPQGIYEYTIPQKLPQ